MLERAFRGERVSNFEAMVRCRDGKQMPVSINTDFLLDKEGKLIGLIEVIRDISLVRELCAKTAEVSELKQRLGEQVQFDHIVSRRECKNGLTFSSHWLLKSHFKYQPCFRQAIV